MSAHISNVRPEFDREIVDIVDYVMNYEITSKVAYDTAHYCLLDTLGCGTEALEYPACKTAGAGRPVQWYRTACAYRTQFQLDPVQAAFNIGAMIRWLDFNDTRLPLSGVILLITSAVFWPRLTGCRVMRWRWGKRR